MGSPVFLIVTAVNNTDSIVHITNVHPWNVEFEFTAVTSSGEVLGNSLVAATELVRPSDSVVLEFPSQLAPQETANFVLLINPWTKSFIQSTNIATLQSFHIRTEFRGMIRNHVSDYSPYRFQCKAMRSPLSLQEEMSITDRNTLFPSIPTSVANKLRTAAPDSILYKNYLMGQQIKKVVEDQEGANQLLRDLPPIVAKAPAEVRAWYRTEVLSFVNREHPSLDGNLNESWPK